MATYILRGVLSFAVRVVGRRTDNLCAELLGAFVMFVNVGHANHYRMTEPVRRQGERAGGFRRRSARIAASIGDDDGSLAERELGAVVPDPQPFYESERAAEPGDRLAHVVICKHWDNHAGWHGT